MNPRFLEFYSQELQYIREMGHEFAQRYPKIAGRLGLGTTEVEDPYVERLLEGFAFLTGRVQYKLDQEFPAFCEQLLECLQPNALAPIPSMGIVQWFPDLKDPQLLSGPIVPTKTKLTSVHRSTRGVPATFRTSQEVQLWPLCIKDVKYQSQPDLPSRLTRSGFDKVVASVSIELELAEGLTFQELNQFDHLDFFINSGDEHAYQFLDHLISNLSVCWVQTQTQCANGAELSFTHLGFADEHALLPEGALNFSGFRLIQEMMAFPEKFLFFRVAGLRRVLGQCMGSVATIHLGLNQKQSAIGQSLNANSLSLYCSPVINWFEHRCDRSTLKGHNKTLLLPDRAHPQDYEIHSIVRVKGYENPHSKGVEIPPLFGPGNQNCPQSLGYAIERHVSVESEIRMAQGGRSRYLGTDTYLSVQNPKEHTELTGGFAQVSIVANCTNRDLPLILPFGRGQEDFQALSNLPNVTAKMVRSPTRPVSRQHSGRQVWELIEHSSINCLSLIQGEKSVEFLQRLLSLYANQTQPDQVALSQSILNIQCDASNEPVLRRGRSLFVRGLVVRLSLDPEQTAGYGFSIPGAVLAHYFSRFVSVNSFVKTQVVGPQVGFDHVWPAMAGSRPIL